MPNYTLSIKAHNRLNELFAISFHNRSTQYRREPVPIFDGFGIQRTSGNITQQPSKEGLSHSLNIIARHHDPIEWQDTRKKALLYKAEIQLEPPPLFRTIANAREYYTNNTRHQYRAQWFEPPDTQAYNDWLNSEEEFSDLDPQDQQYVLDLLSQQRKQYSIRLTEYSQQYYYHIAISNKMQPIYKVRTRTSYISAVLESIGQGSLAPPPTYLETLQDVPNVNKRRDNRKNPTRQSKGKKYGNFEGTSKDINHILGLVNSKSAGKPTHKYTQEDVEWACKYNLRDLAEEAVQLNPTLILPPTPINKE